VTVVQAVFAGLLVLFAGTLPRNLLFAANLHHHAGVPWAVPLAAIYLAAFWWYVAGGGPPAATSALRRESLRANPLPARLWAWSLLAGTLGIVALVALLRLANRLVVLPQQALPDLTGVPMFTVLSLLLAAAPIAGIVEEAAFRGYMQGALERRWGLAVAILISGTLFALVHLDFTPLLWPYYVAVAALYGTVTSLTRSILPAVVLHSGGNLYSNFDLWLHGQAEWQSAAARTPLVWQAGADAAFFVSVAAFVAAALATAWAFRRLAQACRAAGLR
jgi:membrane protease YdiL (CAAX protease family)